MAFTTLPLSPAVPSRAFRFCLAVLAVAPLAACSPTQVDLPSISSRASFEKRVEMYEELRPEARVDAVLTSGGHEVSRSAAYLILANGERIDSAEDLLQVVPKRSVTARRARRIRKARSRAQGLIATSWVIMLAGVAGAIGGVASSDSVDPTPILVGGGIFSLGVVIGMVGMSQGSEIARDQTTAFATYERDLRRKLELCVRDTRLVDCAKKRQARKMQMRK